MKKEIKLYDSFTGKLRMVLPEDENEWSEYEKMAYSQAKLHELEAETIDKMLLEMHSEQK